MRIIHRPDLKSGRRLSALELNKFALTERHTVLTPELLAEMARTGTAQSPGGAHLPGSDARP